MSGRIRAYLGLMRGQFALRATETGPSVRSFRHELADGAGTAVHVAAFPARTTHVRVESIDPPLPLSSWCEETRTRHALVGGFFARGEVSTPLGEVWLRGSRVESHAFDEPWASTRSCVAIDGGRVRMAPRDELPPDPTGDLLQAGPLLVAGHRPVIHDGIDPEGFSANQRQFDSDITVGRYPRAALGVGPGWVLAVACDGRSETDAGLSLRELAELMADLDCERAINLDGGGSTSLVFDGALRNVPREEHGIELVAGRPVVNALVFE